MTQTRDGLKAFQHSLVSSKAHAKGWTFKDDEDHLEAQYKALLFGSAGLAGDQGVIEAAQSMFKEFAAGNKKAIHPNIRNSVYAIALQNGGEREYDVILNEYHTAKDADERNTALRSLARAKGEKLLHRTLSLPLSDEVKGQDVYLPVTGLRSEPETITALFAWMKENWKRLNEKCPPSLTMLGSMVQICTASFTTKEQLEEVQAFFKDKSTKGFERGLDQSLDTIRSKISWLERDGQDVVAFLQKEGYLKEGGKL